MALIEPEKKTTSLDEAIAIADGQLRDLTALAASLLEDIKAGDMEAVKAAGKTADELRKLVRMAIEMEARHERERKREAGITGDYGLDLEQARSDIRCKLGRLRRCGPSGPDSE